MNSIDLAKKRKTWAKPINAKNKTFRETGSGYDDDLGVYCGVPAMRGLIR